MTKEQFLDKWAFKYNVNYTTNPYFIDDIDTVIAHEVSKSQEANEIKKNFYFNKQVMNPYETGSQSYTAYEKGFIEGYNKSHEIAMVQEVKPEELKGNCSTFDGSRLVDQVQPALNPIEQAYERGEKIRCNYWGKDEWIKKHSKTESITECNKIYKNLEIDFHFATHPENWELYTEPTEQPVMTEKEKIDHILTNKLTWKPMGNKRFYANWFSAESDEGYRQVHFVDYNNPHSGYFETRIFTIDLTEWQPVETEKPSSQVKLYNSFDKDRFEAMFRAVVASGRTESYEQDFLATSICLEKLDAYYATKEGGNNG